MSASQRFWTACFPVLSMPHFGYILMIPLHIISFLQIFIYVSTQNVFLLQLILFPFSEFNMVSFDIFHFMAQYGNFKYLWAHSLFILAVLMPFWDKRFIISGYFCFIFFCYEFWLPYFYFCMCFNIHYFKQSCILFC